MAYIALKRGRAAAVSGITENLEFKKDSGGFYFRVQTDKVGRKKAYRIFLKAKLIAFFLNSMVLYKFSPHAQIDAAIIPYICSMLLRIYRLKSPIKKFVAFQK